MLGVMCISSLLSICEYPKISLFGFDEFKKTYIMDHVVFELLETKPTWPKNNSSKASKVTFKYSGLYKISMSN